MITAAQLRAARGLLDWTRQDLAKAAGVSTETVKNIEHGTFRPQETTTNAIIKAFTSRDVQFTDDEGVKFEKDVLKVFKGVQGYKDYLDHIYQVVSAGGARICQFNVSDTVLNFGQKYTETHIQRMSTLEKLDAKVLVPEGDQNFPASYCEYRWLSKSFSMVTPYYVYGDYVSMASYQDNDNIEVVTIYSSFMAEKYRKQFDIFWEQSASLMVSKKR